MPAGLFLLTQIGWLFKKKFWTLGTLYMNHSRNCPVTREKNLKKEGRGLPVRVVAKDKKLVVTAWNENKRMKVSLVQQSYKYTTITWVKPTRRKMLLALYRTKYHSRRRYRRPTFHFIGQCAINVWTILRILQISDRHSHLSY